MTFEKFADLMEEIGYRENEPVAPIFILTKKDLKNPIFKNAYTKTPDCYQVVNIWNNEGEVEFHAKDKLNVGSHIKLYPFLKEEVDFLAKNKKFRKN